MRILITTDAYDAMINGVAVSVKNLCCTLKEEGHDVRILTLAQTPFSYYEQGVYYIKSAAIGIYPDARATYSFGDDFLEEIIEWRPDIVHSQCEFFTFAFARKIAKRLNIPIVHTYHTLYEYYTHYFCPSEALGKKIVASMTKFICDKTDCVIAPTKKTADILHGYGVNAKIAVIPTGISLDKLRKDFTEQEHIEMRKQIGIPKDAPVVMTLGRLAKEKEVGFLIQQMVKLQTKGIHLLIVGDGPERQILESQTRELHLEEVVHFAGMVPSEEVYKYYRLGDVFASASRSETQGLTYIEALSCGLPILCWKDPCLEEILISGENGFYYEDEQEFEERLDAILDHRSEMSARAVACSETFSREIFGKKVLQLYRQVLCERKGKEKCIQFACFPRQIWHRGMGYLVRMKSRKIL